MFALTSLDTKHTLMLVIDRISFSLFQVKMEYTYHVLDRKQGLRI